MLEKNQKSDPPARAASAGFTQTNSPTARFKTEVIRLVNIERKKKGAADLKAMEILGTMADTRAKEASVLFEHTRPDGTRCFTIYAENALKYRAAGENLAYGFKTPEKLVAAWMNSEGHRRNILDSDFKYVGVGYFLKDKGTLYCSTLFYTPKSEK